MKLTEREKQKITKTVFSQFPEHVTNEQVRTIEDIIKTAIYQKKKQNKNKDLEKIDFYGLIKYEKDRFRVSGFTVLRKVPLIEWWNLNA